MKKLLFFLTFLISIQLQANHWVPQQTPTTKWLYKCIFLDTLEGWAAGDSGTVIHTTNGGNLWQLQTVNTSAFIYSIFFLNPRLGWGIANDYSIFHSIILKTTNGGNNWNVSLFPDTTQYLNDV